MELSNEKATIKFIMIMQRNHTKITKHLLDKLKKYSNFEFIFSNFNTFIYPNFLSKQPLKTLQIRDVDLKQYFYIRGEIAPQQNKDAI